jgi:hypothetical protein
MSAPLPGKAAPSFPGAASAVYPAVDRQSGTLAAVKRLAGSLLRYDPT